jgi:uncharacterized membrane protein
MVDIFGEIVNFFTTYYVDPIRNHTGYNIVNTLTYALILVVGVYYVLKLLERMQITIDKEFIMSLLPFMVIGGTARALVDAEVYPDTFLLITPGIYVTIAAFTLAALVVAKAAAGWKGIEYTRILFGMGAVIAVINIALVALNTERPEAAAYIFGLFALFYVPVYYLSQRYPSSFAGGNAYIIGAHIFDASTTFTGIQFYGYVEQHVLTGFFIDVFGPFVMFPLKIVFIALSLYLLEWIIPESDTESLNIKNILKMVIVVLGMGPGIRNMCTILMGA